MSRRGLRIAVSLALPVILGCLASLAHAQPTFTVGTTSVTPNPVQPGVSITIATSITNTSATLASGIIVDEEIYDAAGVKVNQGTTSGQQYTPGQTFQPGETRAYQWFWTIPPTLPAATYTVKIGVFQDHWTSVYTWNNDAARFTVQSSGATIAFSVGAITASPAAIQPGQSVTVTAQVTNTGSAVATGINVLMEMRDPYDASFPGNEAGPSNESFQPGQTKTYTFPITVPANAVQGVYSASVAVFDASWSLRYAWKANATAVTVGTPVDPTFTVGATTVSPAIVLAGQTVTVRTRATNTGAQPAVDVIVDVEIRNAADAKVLQQYVDGQSFAAGQTRDFVYNILIPSTMAPAGYTVNIGVFNRTWSKLYAFGYHLDSLSVSTTDPGRATLTVEMAGAGTGQVTSEPGGIACGAVCSAVYSRGGALITLTATPAAGSMLAGWSGGNCHGRLPSCAVRLVADTVVTATFEPVPPPPIETLLLTLEPNQAVFRPGDMLRLALALSNPGSERPADVYFGILLPSEAGPGFGCPAGDAIAFLGDNFQRIVLTCASTAPQGFAPLMRGVMVAGPVTGVRVPDFWSLPWAAGLPAGPYTLFMVLTSPNAFDDGRVDPEDLLATAVDTVTFVP